MLPTPRRRASEQDEGYGDEHSLGSTQPQQQRSPSKTKGWLAASGGGRERGGERIRDKAGARDGVRFFSSWRRIRPPGKKRKGERISFLSCCRSSIRIMVALPPLLIRFFRSARLGERGLDSRGAHRRRRRREAAARNRIAGGGGTGIRSIGFRWAPKKRKKEKMSPRSICKMGFGPYMFLSFFLV